MFTDKNRPLILISNDDGFRAKGLKSLIECVKTLGNVLVMAPDKGRSGQGCAITSELPIKYWLVSNEPGVRIYACTGTPSDCIKLACDKLLSQRPNLVIGGINHGDNSGINAHYSGTMGVVLEGCMKGISSVAFSLCSHDADADFSPTFLSIIKIVSEILKRGLPKGACLNVNFPEYPPYMGIKVCRQAEGEWVNEWESHLHPRGGDWFWLTGEFVTQEEDETADKIALKNGYVAITPTRIDFTDYQLLEDMKEWNLGV